MLRLGLRQAGPRRAGRRRRWFWPRHLVLLLAGVWLHAACGNTRAESPPASSASLPAAEIGASTLPHGNHDPKFGGVVLMNGDLHFEVVLKPDGRHQVYFSDAARNELPASIASSVSLVISSKGSAPEKVDLQIDETGESWIASGRRVADPEAMARITYTIQGRPYWIDLPFSARPTPATPR